MNEKQRGLSLIDIDRDWQLALDPDNVFWSMLPKNGDSNVMLPEDIMALYKSQQEHLDTEMHNFRFNEPLNCIYIDPTDRCNANCPYCYIPSDLRKNGIQMTGEELDKALQKIVEHFKEAKKNPVIVFHAAEPLLVKDIIFDAIKKYHKKLFFGIQTNALLLEKNDVEFLKKYRTGVGISLDAPDAVINNRSRATTKGNGNFDKAVQAIKWFKGYEGLNVISTVNKFNVSHLSEHVKFLHKLKIPVVLFNPVRVTQKPSLQVKADDIVMAKALIGAVETAMALTKKTGRQIVVGNFANIIIAIIAPTARRMMCDISPCGAGRTFLTVAANGDMLPCGEFTGYREFSGGNIFKESIQKALDSKPFKLARTRMVERIDECAACDFRHICGSPCPAEMYGRGDLYRKAEFCEFYKEMIKYAFKLLAEGKLEYVIRKESLDQMEYEYMY
ncbi:MAG: peptide-modifying radical SAM enzyme CbpB [Nitrospirae bacterium]|nr:peptide-modifying radical SAM enzyme CbpB [Nitrospirota bacterium]